MNHGYAEPDPAQRPKLSDREEPDRLAIQLYHHLASAIDWSGRAAAEVGCGRGGGASHVMRHFGPRELVGLDLTESAIAFCRTHYRIQGLDFIRGDAERLPFPDESLDVVLNVESSGSYGDRMAFFGEVVRVLKPGGFFLFADYRRRRAASRLRRQLASLPLRVVSETGISAEVAQALRLGEERKQRLIDEHVPWIVRPLFRRFAFTGGEEVT